LQVYLEGPSIRSPPAAPHYSLHRCQLPLCHLLKRNLFAHHFICIAGFMACCWLGPNNQSNCLQQKRMISRTYWPSPHGFLSFFFLLVFSFYTPCNIKSFSIISGFCPPACVFVNSIPRTFCAVLILLEWGFLFFLHFSNAPFCWRALRGSGA